MTVSRLYTYAELEALPYDEWNQHEIIGGELHVSRRGYVPHQRVLGNVLAPLLRWSDGPGTGLAIHSLCTVFSEHNVVVPDIVWITQKRMSEGINEHGHLVVAPELVVEVLSPGSENESRDCQTKLDLYSREGVEEYWIVDWQERTIDVYRHADDALELVQTLSGDDILESPLLPGFRLPISGTWPPSL